MSPNRSQGMALLTFRLRTVFPAALTFSNLASSKRRDAHPGHKDRPARSPGNGTTKKPSRLIVAFTTQVSEPIRAVTFPQWLIDFPKEMVLDPPYDIEVFVAKSGEAPSREWYAAKVHGLSIVTQPPGCHIVAVNGVQCASEPYVPGSIYIFELVQNPPMSRVPRPWTPGPSRR